MAREPRRAAPSCRRARDRWRASHVVSILRGAMCDSETRRLLRQTRAYPNRRRTAAQTKRGGGPPVQPVAADDAAFFDMHSASMAAALAGWFVCALFGSVAYNWTFYYLLALAAAPRDILLARQFGALTTRRRRRVEDTGAVRGCAHDATRSRTRIGDPAAHGFLDLPGAMAAATSCLTPGPRQFQHCRAGISRPANRSSGRSPLHGQRRTAPHGRDLSRRRSRKRLSCRSRARGPDEIRRLRRVGLHLGDTPTRHLSDSECSMA